MSRFFIHRPNFAWVIAIFICLAGVLALPSLPVEKYPQVAPPQISVSANYPGASSQVLSNSVTSLIEEELNGAKNLLYYESSSNSNGMASITATFSPGTNPDFAQVDVQNRIKKAEARLPEVVKDQGISVEQRNAGFLMIYSLFFQEGYEDSDPQDLADYMARYINNEIRRVPGVGKVQFFASESAMRVWVNLQDLIGYGLTITDVNKAIAAQNIQVPAGSFGEPPVNSSQEVMATLVVKGTMTSPAEFGTIVLRANEDGSSVTLADVARIEIGAESYQFSSRNGGLPDSSAAVQLAPGANALSTVNAVKQRLEELSVNFPAGYQHSVPYDTSTFVKVAINKVLMTLLEAVVLVFLVMYLFLQNIRYTLIPTIVVPICLLGTLAVMSLFGFSVNMMTMFGMVLAIGILVDDAIVVVEGVERIMAEEGLAPKEATIKAMGQISGAIIGITLVLASVFFPLAFMNGSVGVIYRQFSMSVAVSIIISGFLALTMTPALCATLLKPVQGHQQKKGFFGVFNRFFNRATDGYRSTTKKFAGRTGRIMVIYLSLVVALGFGYKNLPESFVPVEDQGYMIVSLQLPPGATNARTLSIMEKIENYFASRSNMDSNVSILGFSFSGEGQNAGLNFNTLKDWSQRDESQSISKEIAAANEFLSTIKDGMAFAVNPPSIDGLGETGGFALRLLNKGGLNRDEFTSALNQLLAQANSSPKIAYAMLEGQPDAPQLRLEIDREKAQVYGVNFNDINTVISTAFGSSSINEFVNKGRVQRVIVQADNSDRVTPEGLKYLYVSNSEGQQVPLMSFTRLSWESGPVQVSNYNGYNAFKVGGDAVPGLSSGEVMLEMEKFIADLPAGIGYEWTGLSYQEKFAGTQAPILFALALLVVFLLLVALYESWFIPLSVMMIVPVGALGSVLATMVMNMANDVYFKVALITIIGLSAKNAILIVEFARSLHNDGVSIVDAAVEAAKMRFRPIIMTSMAFILGVVPLTIATGAGSASQNAIGTGVIGGMISATVLGTFFAPLLFVWVLTLVEKCKKQPIPSTRVTVASQK